MQRTIRARAAVCALALAGTVFVPRLVEAQQPSATTTTINADGSATVSVVGPGRSAAHE